MKTSPMQRSDAVAFLKQHVLASLATISPEGTPRVRTVYYDCDDSLSLYFLTLENTRKVSDIRANPHAAFVVTDSEESQTLQMEGMFEEITETAAFGPALSKLSSFLYPEGKAAAPVTHMDPAKPRMFKFVPNWVRFGDFTEATGSDEAFCIVE